MTLCESYLHIRISYTGKMAILFRKNRVYGNRSTDYFSQLET